MAKDQAKSFSLQLAQIRLLPHTYATWASKGEWKSFWYLKIIGRKIAELIEQGRGRLIILGPPRHGKSELISFWTPRWFLERWPRKTVILTTYEGTFARFWGMRVRDSIKQDGTSWVKVKPDFESADWWLTTEGGGMITAGVGGPIVGKGGHLLLIDDAIKNQEEADSEIIQNRNINWFQTTFYSRRNNPQATIIVFMTLWNRKSLVSWLMTEHPDKWTILKFPAIAELDDPFGRKEGEALCPEFFPLEELELTRTATMKKDPSHWYGLYQQHVVDPQGGLFKRQWFRYFTDYPPGFYSSYLTVDLAFAQKKTADYTVVMHTKTDGHGKLFVHDYVRGRMQISELVNVLFDYKRRIPTLRGVWVELQASETETNSATLYAIREEMKRRGEFFRLEGLKAVKDKVARAQALIDLFANGMVFLREDQHELIQELLTFTGVDDEHDDLVDALAYAPMITKPGKPMKVPQPVVDDDLIGY